MYPTIKGVVIYLTAIFSGSTSPYYPTVVVDTGTKSSIEVPAGAEGTYWPKREWMTAYIISPDQNQDLEFSIRDTPSSASSVVIALMNYNPADWNMDGFINGVDFDGFTAAFEKGDISADFNGDGFVNGADFDLFTDYWVNPWPAREIISFYIKI